ncbi:MAG TPA: hypothetical protein VGQ83_07575, partial [Polyangia bacterium]
VLLLAGGAALASAVASCGDLVGFGGPATPLATVQVQVTGDPAPFAPSWTAGAPPRLRVALVWGQQWLPEPLCLLPPASDAAAAVIAAGCPDLLGFVPARVAADAAVAPDGTARLELMTLPGADVMVGDVTARVAYGSVYVYDDRNGNGTLDLDELHQGGGEHHTPALTADAGIELDADIIYGASFISMTLPDQRLAFREGAFNAVMAFYPRGGCPEPPPGFSLLTAGGFSLADAIAAQLAGQLPQEDPATCGAAPLDAAVVTVPVQAPEPIKQLACVPRNTSGTARYRDPPADQDAPDLANLTWACAPLPRLPGDDGGVASTATQLVVAGPPAAPCRSLTHYTLRGCEDDPACPTAAWDLTATPPAWWPCPVTP